MLSIELTEKLKNNGITVNYLHPGNIKSYLLRHLTGVEKMMARIMIRMASPTEVGADRIVRLAISSEFDRISGVYLAEDTVKPAHKEAKNASKRAHIKTIADKPLRAWL